MAYFSIVRLFWKREFTFVVYNIVIAVSKGGRGSHIWKRFGLVENKRLHFWSRISKGGAHIQIALPSPSSQIQITVRWPRLSTQKSKGYISGVEYPRLSTQKIRGYISGVEYPREGWAHIRKEVWTCGGRKAHLFLLKAPTSRPTAATKIQLETKNCHNCHNCRKIAKWSPIHLFLLKAPTSRPTAATKI